MLSVLVIFVLGMLFMGTKSVGSVADKLSDAIRDIADGALQVPHVQHALECVRRFTQTVVAVPTFILSWPATSAVLYGLHMVLPMPEAFIGLVLLPVEQSFAGSSDCFTWSANVIGLLGVIVALSGCLRGWFLEAAPSPTMLWAWSSESKAWEKNRYVGDR